MESTAKCELVGNQPTVTLDARFVGFSNTTAVTGTIKLDGVLVKTVAAADVTFVGNDGRLVYSTTTTGGQRTIEGDFTWPGKTASDNGAAHHVVECPTPKQPAILLDKTGAATAAAGDAVHLHVQGDEHRRRDATNVALTTSASRR